MEMRISKIMIVLFDIVTVNVTFLLAYTLRFGIGGDLTISSVLISCGLLTFLTVSVFGFERLYDIKMFINKTYLICQLVRSIILILIIFITYQFLSKSFLVEPSRLVIGIFGLCFVILTPLIRVLFLPWFLERLYKRGWLTRTRILVIKPADTELHISKLFEEKPVLGYEIAGFTDNLYTLREAIDNYKPAELMLVSDARRYNSLYKQIEKCLSTGLGVTVVSKLFDKLNLKDPWLHVKGLPTLFFKNQKDTTLSHAIKRILDIVGSIIALIVFSPIFILASLLIKLSSKGAVLFKQTRLTVNQKPFTFLKFRTMYSGTSDELHRQYVEAFVKAEGDPPGENFYKMQNDPRVTPIGRFLRKTTIDEVPQLLNVLRGDMSLVGPRPPLPYEVKYYKSWHLRRLEVKQGMSGPWAVYGRSAVPFDGEVFMDIYYVINHSILMDLDLIIRIIPAAMLIGRGAA